jgi:hypothetical protein
MSFFYNFDFGGYGSFAPARTILFMEKYILSVCIVLSLCFLGTNRIYSQTPDTTISSTTTSDSGYVKGVTPMRARALAGGILGLISLIISWRARSRSVAGIGNKGRNGAVVALLLGAIAIVLSIIHLSVTAGAVFGSGSGKAGAIVAIFLNSIGMVLAALALKKSKRNG